jgi:glycosyltransferase involved in cell wall biosynthesis
MKICIDHGLPFLFAHGGFQIQIEQTKLALEKLGVDVDWMRWWDASLRPDVIHYFGPVSSTYVQYAHRKGIKVVMSELRGGLGARAAWKIALQARFTAIARRTLPAGVLARMGWDMYQCVDAATALTPLEKTLMRDVFGCDVSRLHVIPNGVDEPFFETRPVPKNEWLVCTATIDPRKRVLELARSAAEAGTPVWIIGRPYSETDSYYQAFLQVVQSNPRTIRYEGAIDDRRRLAEIYRSARGFVLVSTMETLSLSALEAAACHCPLLFSDLAWARVTFGDHASYCPNTADTGTIARELRRFYDADHSRKTPFTPLRWSQVAEKLRALYASLLAA